MNYAEAIEYIHNINWSFCKPGLERINELCEKLGHPEQKLKFIHVAGTNGKGSFCAMAEAILRASGYKTGLYTSPYIQEFNERMRVNGENISDRELVELTEYVRPIADAMQDKPTEFELITAIAFEYFRRQNCDVVVLEVGLGGRLDSTNLITSPLLSVITGIDFDHTGLLGNTIQKIAAEKGGIIKNSCPALYGGNDSSACRTLSTIASTRHSPFYTVDCSRLRVKSYSLTETVFDFGDMENLKLRLLGTYQSSNVSTVLTAMEILSESAGMRITEEAIRQGLSSVRWPARFELIRKADPIVIYDGSHNPQGVGCAVKSAETYFPEQKVNILSGVMADKDYDGMIECMKPIAQNVYTTTPGNPRALPAEEYAQHFASHQLPARAIASVAECVRTAMEESRAQGRPLLCLGSLYLYRELREAVDALE